MQLYRYVIIDGHRYPVSQGSYFRSWVRVYSTQLVSGLIRLGFMDRGPGVRVYKMQLIIQTWKPGSQPYEDGITETWDTQIQNLEASYAKLATVIHFTDPLGQSPGPSAQYGVFFTNLDEEIPNYATPSKPFLLCHVEMTEATQQVA
jgi:hypothetical protein